MLDKNLRIAVYSHKYDIALVLRDKGGNRVNLSKKEVFEHFKGLSKATLIQLDAEKIGMLFSPDCLDSVMHGYLNAVLNYFLNRSSAYEFTFLDNDPSCFRPSVIVECAKSMTPQRLTDVLFVMLKWNPVDRWTDFQKYNLLNLQHDAFIAKKKRHVVALLEAGADVNAANGEAFLLTARLSKHDALLSLLLRQKEIRKSPGFLAAFEHVVRHNDSPEMTKLFIEAMQDGEFVPVQRND